MKKKRNFLLKSILLQLNFSLEKAGILLVLVLVFSIQAKAYSQTRITAKRQGVTIDEVLKEVREKSGYRFLYRVEEVNRYGKRDIDVKDAEVEDFLGQLLQNTDLTYEVENEVIIIRPEKQRQDSRVNVQVVRGKVTDENNLALPGATVLLKGTSYGVVTDSHGKFTMEVLERDTVTLLVSFVGMETRLVNLKKGQTEILVSLKPDIKEMKEVVVTGYGNVRKTSFTGNSVTVTKDELMSVSKSNVIKALQTFDPSFRIQTNNDWGSDPNALPEMYVRGRSGISGVKELDRDPLTKSALKDNPNLPTFIMDGFQISVEQLYDMDPNRIESITILKDAAATALYGSRAANGVVVITTVAPQMGKLNVSYNFTGDVTVPDLSDYNLMNAREKLETEVAAGVFEDLAKDNPLGAEQQYYAKLASITRGVDTYWLSKPLQTSFNHKHSLSVDGGSDNFRFGIQLSYNNEDGVMKESFRNRVGAGVYLDYRIGSFQLKNMVTYTNTRSQESPYGAFSDYTGCQPYDPYKDDEGNYLENLPNWDGKNEKRPNPLYEATLSNFDKSKYEEFVDNLGINWNITTGLLWKTQFSLTRKITDTKRFLDPLSSKNTTPQTAENPSSGELNTSRGNEFYWDLSSTLSYNRSVEKHHINLLLGVNARSAKTDNISASYRGFPSGALSSPNYAEEIVSKPVSSDNSTRLIGFPGDPELQL
ncbi:MAG: carboxypeptidase-like regulatory domain-containing protein [Odoribacter splanchnicus]